MEKNNTTRDYRSVHIAFRQFQIGSLIWDALLFWCLFEIEIDAIDYKTIKRSVVNPCVGQMTSGNANAVASIVFAFVFNANNTHTLYVTHWLRKPSCVIIAFMGLEQIYLYAWNAVAQCTSITSTILLNNRKVIFERPATLTITHTHIKLDKQAFSTHSLQKQIERPNVRVCECVSCEDCSICKDGEIHFLIIASSSCAPKQRAKKSENAIDWSICKNLKWWLWKSSSRWIIFKRFHSTVHHPFKIPNGTHTRLHMQTPNLIILYSVHFWQTEIRFFWQTIHFCSMKWKVFIVIFFRPFLFLFQTEQFTWPYSHTRAWKKYAHVLIQFVLLFFAVVMRCSYLYLDCFVFIRAVLLQSCKIFNSAF